MAARPIPPPRSLPRTQSEGFVGHALELLSPPGTLGRIRARRMFGGHGVYLDGLFIAIVAGERLFLKADATTAPHFIAAGCEPFSYTARGALMTMNYWQPPAEALDSPAAMAPWARLALQAAMAAAALKAPKSAPSGRAAPSAAPRAPRRARSG